MAVTIRPANVNDFVQIYKLGLECYHVEDKPYNYWSMQEVAYHLQEEPEVCIVAEDGGRVIGFALGAKSFEILENTGHLEWIAVAADYRRQGISGQLIETAVNAFRKLEKRQVVSDISSANAASQGMARKSGFVEGISVTFFVKEL